MTITTNYFDPTGGMTLDSLDSLNIKNKNGTFITPFMRGMFPLMQFNPVKTRFKKTRKHSAKKIQRDKHWRF